MMRLKILLKMILKNSKLAQTWLIGKVEFVISSKGGDKNCTKWKKEIQHCEETCQGVYQIKLDFEDASLLDDQDSPENIPMIA